MVVNEPNESQSERKNVFFKFIFHRVVDNRNKIKTYITLRQSIYTYAFFRFWWQNCWKKIKMKFMTKVLDLVEVIYIRLNFCVIKIKQHHVISYRRVVMCLFYVTYASHFFEIYIPSSHYHVRHSTINRININLNWVHKKIFAKSIAFAHMCCALVCCKTGMQRSEDKKKQAIRHTKIWN